MPVNKNSLISRLVILPVALSIPPLNQWLIAEMKIPAFPDPHSARLKDVICSAGIKGHCYKSDY
jgi:hypothetical protein